jgi:hypothetical protein
LWQYSPWWTLASSKIAVRFRSFSTKHFYGVRLLAPRPTPTWRTSLSLFVWVITFDILYLITPVKETCPAISEQLTVTIARATRRIDHCYYVTLWRISIRMKTVSVQSNHWLTWHGLKQIACLSVNLRWQVAVERW